MRPRVSVYRCLTPGVRRNLRRSGKVIDVNWGGQKDLFTRTGREEAKGKTQERMERGSRKGY